jgi:hypothetical protein
MRHELVDRAATIAQQPNYVIGRAISQPDPNDLWRRPMKDAEAVEILILADNEKTVLSRIPPNCLIGSRAQANIADMQRSRMNIGERCGNAG